MGLVHLKESQANGLAQEKHELMSVLQLEAQTSFSEEQRQSRIGERIPWSRIEIKLYLIVSAWFWSGCFRALLPLAMCCTKGGERKPFWRKHGGRIRKLAARWIFPDLCRQRNGWPMHDSTGARHPLKCAFASALKLWRGAFQAIICAVREAMRTAGRAPEWRFSPHYLTYQTTENECS